MYAALAVAALGFNGPLNRPVAGRANVVMEKSRAVPMLDLNPALSGLLGAETGFDPLGLATPGNKQWMREAELKHGRVCMLATLGYVAVDLGFKFPGEKYAGLTSLQAHDAMVKSGNMFWLFLVCALVETVTFADNIDMLTGESSKKGGVLGFDPLGFSKGKDADRLALAELKNGRLAMVAFSGIVTQAALTGKGFPYV